MPEFSNQKQSRMTVKRVSQLIRTDIYCPFRVRQKTNNKLFLKLICSLDANIQYHPQCHNYLSADI